MLGSRRYPKEALLAAFGVTPGGLVDFSSEDFMRELLTPGPGAARGRGGVEADGGHAPAL
ncbi:hypothetical protein [Archangium lansingense]|uniref:Uncharacterized protein n=1 Tax=Archangium lansingense TaxID=2995310 RepID=A0ABT3ZYT6_9BACT|nr:hypothetical protein [Archangium lansinium]MCY1074543.1 hypothetical protein [Archangium lansinium]